MDSSNFNVNQGNVENSPRKSGRWASRLRNSPLWPGLSLGLGSRVWYVWYSVLLRVVTPCHTSHSSHPSHPSHRIHPFCFFLCSISLHRNLERKNFNPKASQLCPLRIVFPSDTNMTRVEAFDSTAWLLPWLSRHFPKHTDYRSYRSHVSSQLWDDENIGKSEWKSSCKRKTSDHGDQRVINESEMQPFTCLFLKMSDHEYELDIKKTQSLKHPPIQSNSIQFNPTNSAQIENLLDHEALTAMGQQWKNQGRDRGGSPTPGESKAAKWLWRQEKNGQTWNIHTYQRSIVSKSPLVWTTGSSRHDAIIQSNGTKSVSVLATDLPMPTLMGKASGHCCHKTPSKQALLQRDQCIWRHRLTVSRLSQCSQKVRSTSKTIMGRPVSILCLHVPPPLTQENFTVKKFCNYKPHQPRQLCHPEAGEWSGDNKKEPHPWQRCKSILKAKHPGMSNRMWSTKVQRYHWHGWHDENPNSTARTQTPRLSRVMKVHAAASPLAPTWKLGILTSKSGESNSM